MLTFLSFVINFLGRYKVFKRLFNVEKESRITLYPKEYHTVIHNFNKKIRRVLFVGDVHGCCDELFELLELFGVERQQEETLIVFLGDLVNKGPKSVETLRFVRSLGQMAVSVRGNHEQAVLSRLQKLKETSTRLPKQYSWILDLTVDEITFLKQLPFTISLPFLNVIVVHGGLVPGVKLRDQFPDNMINMRNYIPENLSGTGDIDQGLPWGSQWPGPEFVIFGHDARRLLQKYKHALGLDTGCLYGRKLTGFLVHVDDKYPLENGLIMSVPAHKAYVKT